MPEIVDVSAAFYNCAFHGIASHLLAYPEATAEFGIIDQLFKRPKGESALTDLFDGEQAFEDFFLKVRADKKKRFQGDETEGETFEKVLILGMALRNYLKQILLSDKQVRDNLQAQFIKMVHEAEDNIKALGYECFIESIAQTENGVMAEASQAIFTRQDLDTLTDEDLASLWQAIYADAYANRVGELDVTLSYHDIAPLCPKLRISLNVFAYEPDVENLHGRLLVAQTLDDEPAHVNNGEPLTLLLDEEEAHYHVELPEDNVFTKQFKADSALYARARENTGGFELVAADKNDLADHAKLLFLASVLSDSDQSKDRRANFLNSIRKHLPNPSISREDESFCLPRMAPLISGLSAGHRSQLDNAYLNELIEYVASYMAKASNTVIRFRGLNGLKQHCCQAYNYSFWMTESVDKQLDAKIKKLNFYKNSSIFVDLLAGLNKLQLMDKLVLKLAIYGLFTRQSIEDKTNVCNNLLDLASLLNGAADPSLRDAAVIIFSFFSVVAITFGVMSGAIGIALGVWALGALCSGAMYYAGLATKDSRALTTFIEAYRAQELQSFPTPVSGKI